MWAGQMLCECFNYMLKHIIQEERPNRECTQICASLCRLTEFECAEHLGDGYGFPSSHSQWMGYFASFLFLHFTLRHRWTPTGFRTLDLARDVFLYAFIFVWAGAVAFSRYVLPMVLYVSSPAEACALQVLSLISQCPPSPMGLRDRRRLWHDILHAHRTHPYTQAKLAPGRVPYGVACKSRVYMVSHTGWVVGLAR